MADTVASAVPHAASHDRSHRSRLLPLTLTALGVVYGDIGTSPLYAIRECFYGSHSVAPTHENVLGVLSLIIYSLLLVVSVKYVGIVLRADNQGEGGMLALTALIPGAAGRPLLIALGIFGTALLYGEGMITPAISVLSAVEGLEIATPVFAPYVVPIATVILVALFVVQQYGTHRVGSMFGVVVVLWFVTVAVLGLSWIVRVPQVFGAIDPRHAVTFFQVNRFTGFAVLGAVFLVVTGCEALYADIGHFGRGPIRLGWFAVVLPALLLNYLGQGALLLTEGDHARQPFFLMAPAWATLPLVGLATLAAIIASQAMISGSFSLTRQAIQLGYSPRLDVEHTSSHTMGQIYVPQVNWGLMVVTILIVLGFGSSTRIAAAYGMGVSTTMIITGVLLFVVSTERWRWPPAAAIAVTALFLSIDLAFFSANLLKVFSGGWLPLLIATTIFTIMTTWKTGRRLMQERITSRAVPLEDFMAAIHETPPARVPGTAVFMTAQPHGTPPALAHNLRYNKVLHEHVVVLTVTTADVPHVALADQVEVQPLDGSVYFMRVRYGFMQDPDVPGALAAAQAKGMEMTPEDVTYFLGRETILVTRRPGMAPWREKLFVLMSRNAQRATAFFKLPPERVVELGVQVEI